MEEDPRPDWDSYFLNFARVASTRSACFRNQVGAVIVNDKSVVSTGYNGAPRFQPNCQEMGFCYRDQNQIVSGTQLELCRAVGSHAESNAIALAARDGHATNNCTIYIVGHKTICNQCRAQIANCGIHRVLLEDPDGNRLEFFPSRDWTVHPIDQ